MQSKTLHTRLMGSDFELIATGENMAIIEQRLSMGVNEIQRIENLLTEFNDSSITGQLNAQHLQPLQVPAEVYGLLQRCQHLSQVTQGAFDITAGALKRLWRFKEKGFHWPAPEAIATALASTGYRHIRLLSDRQVLLEKKGMHIGFGAVGKGYAADRVRALWKAHGADSGVINASGDLTAWGTQPDGTPWKVGIANPDDRQVLFWLPVQNAAVATSGNYEQYVEKDGVRYSHNIDPRKGMPVPYIKSVTVISPSAELSDALATAVTVMGVSAGIYLVNQLPDVHCILIDEQHKIHRSEQLKIS
jgi:thiamine biosynthesis lipoprotein